MAKKGLYYNINKRKEKGISRPKSKSTISPEAYKNMQEGFPNSKKNRGSYMKKKKGFKPHMMYDKNGKAYKAEKMEDHLRMKKKGFTHSKGAYMQKKDMGYAMKKKKKSFPDLTGDGKVTMADILKGRGVTKGAYMHAMKKKSGMFLKGMMKKKKPKSSGSSIPDVNNDGEIDGIDYAHFRTKRGRRQTGVMKDTKRGGTAPSDSTKKAGFYMKKKKKRYK